MRFFYPSHRLKHPSKNISRLLILLLILLTLPVLILTHTTTKKPSTLLRPQTFATPTIFPLLNRVTGLSLSANISSLTNLINRSIYHDLQIDCSKSMLDILNTHHTAYLQIHVARIDASWLIASTFATIFTAVHYFDSTETIRGLTELSLLLNHTSSTNDPLSSTLDTARSQVQQVRDCLEVYDKRVNEYVKDGRKHPLIEGYRRALVGPKKDVILLEYTGWMGARITEFERIVKEIEKVVEGEGKMWARVIGQVEVVRGEIVERVRAGSDGGKGREFHERKWIRGRLVHIMEVIGGGRGVLVGYKFSGEMEW